MDLKAKIPVGVLGATGSVGQRFVSLLAAHPWFEIAVLTASERSAGKRYADAVSWGLDQPLDSRLGALTIEPTRPGLPCQLLFSALDAEVAGLLETELARAGHVVVSNARNHRMDNDVPLIVPEVNPDHLALAARQTHGGGVILTNPNCSTIGLVLALAPLHRSFGLTAVQVVTLQALSGAGLPGVPSVAIHDNVIPFISGEEEKMESETLKVLGRLTPDGVEPAPIAVSAQCNRVAVLDGHTECVSVKLARPAGEMEVRAALAGFSAEPQRLGLPSAPHPPVALVDERDRPQARLDRGRSGGMAATVGRVRPCPVLDYRFVVLSHNTIRGAAGGSILIAELALAKGLIPAEKLPLATTARR